MRTRVLQINDLHVSGEPTVYTCFGLGSCIGLFIADRISGLTGGVHIPLPESSTMGEFLSAAQLIDMLLADFEQMGSRLGYLRAKMAGGAQVYESLIDLGRQNADAVSTYLVQRKIYLAATDIGGRMARTVRFNSLTEELHISTSEPKTYTI
jgi:chemotaxis protein CheD